MDKVIHLSETGKWSITIIIVVTFPLWVIPAVVLGFLWMSCFEMHKLLWEWNRSEIDEE